MAMLSYRALPTTVFHHLGAACIDKGLSLQCELMGGDLGIR